MAGDELYAVTVDETRPVIRLRVRPTPGLVAELELAPEEALDLASRIMRAAEELAHAR